MAVNQPTSTILRGIILAATFILIVLTVGSQVPDVYDNSRLMPAGNFMINYINLFLVFPVCYLFFFMQARKIPNKNIKGGLFLLLALAISLYGFVYLNNSHPLENGRASEFSNYYASGTKMFVPVIIAAEIAIGIVYLVLGKKQY